jgi:DNA repair exonuclease SbcCD nuclease subunit
MLHAGLEGQLAHMGRLKQNDLAPLRKHIDYVALGHIHKPYAIDDWIYNPGSLETCSMDENAWPDRGCYLVEVRPGQSPPHLARRRSTPRRPFHRFRLEVDGLTDPAAVYDAVRARIRREERAVVRDPAPVIELTLTGVLPFNRYELDLDYIQGLLEEAWSPLTARVQSKITPAEFEVDVDSEVTRAELEQRVVRQIIERDARYRPESEAWTEGALELKRLVLEGSPPEAIVDYLRQLRNAVALHEEA